MNKKEIKKVNVPNVLNYIKNKARSGDLRTGSIYTSNFTFMKIMVIYWGSLNHFSKKCYGKYKLFSRRTDNAVCIS